MAHAVKGSGVSGRVLLADDEEWVREALCYVLTTAGYRVVEAVDGEDAVQIFLQSPQDFDVVLADLNMPRLGGDEAIRRIKAHHPGAKAILMSGGIELPPKFEQGDILQKPFQQKELLDKVRERVVKSAS